MRVPLDSRIIVKVPKLERKTAGGIILADERVERDEMAQVEAIILAIGEFAFPDLYFRPGIGDKIGIARYAGQTYEDENGEEIRVLDTVAGSSDVTWYEDASQTDPDFYTQRKRIENE